MNLPAFLVLACGLVPITGAREDPKQELAKLQGNWTLVSQERDGKPVATDRDTAVTVTGDQFATKAGERTLRAGTLVLDPAKTPRAIDVSYSEGQFKGQTLKGIYTLESGTWRILYALPGKDRPKVMADQAREGQMLLVLKRLDR